MREQITGTIRKARIDDASALTGLALRSKAHWGYSQEFMAAFQPELIITEAYLSSAPVFVAEQKDRIVGFAGLSAKDVPPELVFLFIEPEFIAKGWGELLWQKCLDEARTLGWRSFVIVADPNAEQFYTKRGAIKIGEKSFAVTPNRKVPVLKYDLG